MSSAKKNNYTPYFVHYIYCLALILLLLVAGVNTNNYISSRKVLGATTDYSPIKNEIEYWQRVIDKSPTYVDGYLELARLNLEVGYKKGAEYYINKAIELDPNSSKIPEVKLTLGL